MAQIGAPPDKYQPLPGRGIGDNQPGPLDLLAEATASIKARILDLRVALERVPDEITPEIEGLVGDQLRQVHLAVKALNEIRDEHKRPHDAMANAVQKHCKTIEGLVGTRTGTGIWAKVLKRFDAYQDTRDAKADEAHAAKRERLAFIADHDYRAAETLASQASQAARNAVTDVDRQRAALLAEQANQVMASADAAADELAGLGERVVHQNIRGSASQVVRRERPAFEVIDPALVPAEYWSVDSVKIKSAVDAGITTIPGVKIWMTRISTVLGS